MYELPYGNTQQLNLDWFIKRWKEFYEEWEQTKTEIDGALDEEVQKVEDAMEDLYAARDAAAASATAAAASAASASNDATIAANAATAAAASATLANTKATAAGLSEAAAALSASQAANDATAAATSASQASASASSATDSAQAAATSEQNIESIIEDAIQDATDAAVAEATADAEAAATAAESSASDAADSATAAAASATAADSSADDAADSATAAAGSATAAAGSASDAADSATAAAASAASIVVDSAMSDSSTNPVQNKVINGEITELKTAITQKSDWYDYTVSGAVAKIEDGIPNLPIKGIALNVDYAQSGSGYASMTNVRTITVPTSLKVNHSGSDTSDPTEYDFDASQLLATGTLSYNGDGTWTLTPKYVLVEVPYAFFSSASEKGLSSSGDSVWFRNCFYSSGNGVTYRNTKRRSGGYFCISNAFSVVKGLNDTKNNSSQYRLYLRNQSGWTTAAEALADIQSYYNNGGTVQFLYEPTDTLPTYSFTTEQIVALSGENNFWGNSGDISVTYAVDVSELLASIEDEISDIGDIVYNPTPETDILGANDDAVNKIWASRWLRSETAVPLSLLWFTDLHRWQTPLDRVIKFKNYLQTNGIIDDSIVTGDLVRNSAGEGNTFKTFWEGTSGAEDIMIALGNHDHYAQSETPHGRATFETLDNLFFGNVANWDVTRESNYPFYYKDYLDKGIRLIVADTFVKTAEADQTTWINNLLSDAITKNLAVVIACHYLALNSSMETQSVTIYDNSWSNNLARATGTDTMDYESTDFDLVACVTDFIADGGSFLCYMIGHTHTDIVSYPTGHPDQLIINCACASPDRSHETKLTTNDLPRYENTRTQDCFNVITFDATNKIIKCVRVGANVNMYQIPRTAFGYDVTNHQFISLI